MKKPLIILTGPTAVGKSKLSIQLAKRIGAEIISADSMQVYRNMDVGTAKINREEMQGIPHYLIDVLEPHEEFNVVKFQMYAKKCMDEIYSRGKIPILVGGTGFYIQAILYDIDFSNTEEDDTIRSGLERLASLNGAEYMHQMLRSVDEEAAGAIHPNNVKRVIRAIEYYKQTGQKISAHNKIQREKESPYNFAYFVLNHDRSVLYERINERVDGMIENGLIDEVKSLHDRGFTKDMVSMQGLGYKEILAYLSGDYTLEEAVILLKKETRHFAKRQLTWFKRETDVLMINKREYGDDEEKILAAILLELQNKKIIDSDILK